MTADSHAFFLSKQLPVERAIVDGLGDMMHVAKGLLGLNCYTEERMVETIEFEHFEQVDVRVGTVLSTTPNTKARKPAYVLEVDFGPFGVKTTSAQLTQNYAAQDLVGRQVVAIVNFPPRRVAGVKSQVLVLAAVSEEKGVVLLQPNSPVENGTKVA